MKQKYIYPAFYSSIITILCSSRHNILKVLSITCKITTQATMLSCGEFASISSASKPCWTCVRRRVKCDLGLPTCFKCKSNHRECLGYGSNKPIVWTGVPCRKKANARRLNGSCAIPTSTELPRRTDAGYQIPHSNANVSANPTDPVFQDLSLGTRRNVEYCECISANKWTVVI